VNWNLRKALPQRIEELAQGVARGMKGDAELDYKFSYPVSRNDPEMTARALETARHLFGSEQVFETTQPSMAAEGFALLFREASGSIHLARNEGRGAHVLSAQPHLRSDLTY
jgi:hippurate hydrolase